MLAIVGVFGCDLIRFLISVEHKLAVEKEGHKANSSHVAGPPMECKPMLVS